MKTNKSQLEWLKKEIQKDNQELQKEKAGLISEIKKLKKEDILPQKPKPLTLWQRIKKVLMN